ncbi:MAG: glycerophosphodiester phosphodiesterase family protein [Planctomycetota bacterium]|nr:glycerophosphodiester phosphodiesterase family protein [Planctomycetota bacterium]
MRLLMFYLVGILLVFHVLQRPRVGALTPKEPIQVIAHRGASSRFPENTRASTLAAVSSGATVIEADVRTTRDGHLVVLHDATLDRTTAGSGPVGEKTLAEIRQYDAGTWFHPRFSDQRVLTLSEVYAICRGKMDVLLDLKETGEEYDRKVAAQVREGKDSRRTIIGVRSVAQAKRFRQLLPGSRQLGLVGNPDEIVAFAEVGVSMIRLWPRWLTDTSLIEKVRKSGCTLHLNGKLGTTAEVARLLRHCPNSLSSDDPAQLVKTLKETGHVVQRPGNLDSGKQFPLPPGGK